MTINTGHYHPKTFLIVMIYMKVIQILSYSGEQFSESYDVKNMVDSALWRSGSDFVFG